MGEGSSFSQSVSVVIGVVAQTYVSDRRYTGSSSAKRINRTLRCVVQIGFVRTPLSLVRENRGTAISIVASNNAPYERIIITPG